MRSFKFQVVALPFLLAFAVGGPGFRLCAELCLLVTGWRHAFRSEWPFSLLIIPRFF